MASSSNERVGPVPGDAGSTLTLLSRLVDNAAALARNEIALAKAELREALSDLKIGVMALMLAVLVLVAGLLSLVAAAIVALAQAVEWWLAALIVGLVLSAIGAALFVAARRKLLDPSAEMGKTRSAMEKDATVIARRT